MHTSRKINTAWPFALLFALALGLLTACGGKQEEKAKTDDKSVSDVLAAGPGKAAGIKPEDIKLGALDAKLADAGKAVYELKCAACHSLGANRVVGPGWQGITTRREPHWIMNMILNTDAMLASDATAQKQLEECLVRMPNQNLTLDDGRNVLEFMRKQDGAK